MSRIDAVQRPITASEAVVHESDTELLHSFVVKRTDSAFEELMRRHGPMVMGVCRRVLPEPHDAEDAYQTTFLLLVQKSATIRRPERLANWLFGVAYRVAARIRAKVGNQESLRMQSPEISTEDNADELARRELQSVLDEELHRLPVTHRLPLILCYLEGKTHVEAARELGWPSGSMSARLTQAREKLRRRLARRGLTFTSALFGMLLDERTYGDALSPALIQSTTRAAMIYASGKPLSPEAVSQSVAGLLEEMNERMRVAKAREAAFLMLLLLLFLLGSAVTAVSVLHGEMTVQAERHGETIPPPLSSSAQSGRSAILAMTPIQSSNRAATEVREHFTPAAPNDSESSCH